jgi:hypothetical protein
MRNIWCCFRGDRGGEKMKKKFLGFFVGLLAVVMLATPVMAKGPIKALEVGKNPNLETTITGYNGVINIRGKAGGSLITVLEDDIWVQWNWFSASAGKGKMNNAIEAGPPDVMIFDIMAADTEAFKNGEETLLENKWIFMSPEGSGKQGPPGSPNPHGMVYWMYFGLAMEGGASVPEAFAFAEEHAAMFPDGVFWKYNFIKAN